MEPEDVGYTQYEEGGCVVVKQRAAPLWETLWVMPFVVLSPVMAAAAIFAAYAMLFLASGDTSLYLRVGLAVMFLAGAIPAVWLFWGLVSGILPITRKLRQEGDYLECRSFMCRMRYLRRRLAYPLRVVVVLYGHRGDWGFSIRLADRDNHRFYLTVATSVSASKETAKAVATAFSSPIAQRLTADIVLEEKN